MMRKVRNGALALLCGLLFCIARMPLRAEALTCYEISGGFYQECETDTYGPSCVHLGNDPVAEWCATYEQDTCDEFCGYNNVIHSSCDAGSVWYGGMEQICASDLYIWCQCSEVE